MLKNETWMKTYAPSSQVYFFIEISMLFQATMKTSTPRGIPSFHLSLVRVSGGITFDDIPKFHRWNDLTACSSRREIFPVIRVTKLRKATEINDPTVELCPTAFENLGTPISTKSVSCSSLRCAYMRTAIAIATRKL